MKYHDVAHHILNIVWFDSSSQPCSGSIEGVIAFSKYMCSLKNSFNFQYHFAPYFGAIILRVSSSFSSAEVELNKVMLSKILNDRDYLKEILYDLDVVLVRKSVNNLMIGY